MNPHLPRRVSIALVVAFALPPSLAALPATAQGEDVTVTIPVTGEAITVTIAVPETPARPAPIAAPAPVATNPAAPLPVDIGPPTAAPTPTAAPAPAAPQPPAPRQTAAANPAPIPASPTQTIPAPTVNPTTAALAPPPGPAASSSAPVEVDIAPPTPAPSVVPAPGRPVAPVPTADPTSSPPFVPPAPTRPVTPAPSRPPAPPTSPAPSRPAPPVPARRGTLPPEVRGASHTAGGVTSTYHLFSEQVQEQGRPLGLVVYLDGDGQHGVTDGLESSYALGGEDGIVEAAAARGYPVLAPVAPGGHSWYTDDPEAKAAWLAHLIEQVRTEHDLLNAPVELIGFSGGSQGITKYLLPGHAQAITNAGGGAIIAGGGGAPSDIPQVSPDFALHFTTGSEDTGPGYNARADAARGADAYLDAGAPVTTATPPGQDHGETPPTLGRVLAQQLDKTPASTPGQGPAPITSGASPAPSGAPPSSTPPAAPPASPLTNTAVGQAAQRTTPQATRASGMPFASGVFAHNTGYVEAWQDTVGHSADVLAVFPQRGSWESQLDPWWLDTAPEGFTGNLSVGIPPWPEDGSLEVAAEGGYEQQWREFARLVASRYPNAYIRLGWEFNLPGWYYAATDANAAQWVSAWRHAVTAMRAEAPGLRMSWNPNGGPSQSIAQATDVYPGDEYVDDIGVDQYDWWPPVTSDEAWHEHLTKEGGLQVWADFARSHGKTLSVPEWGVVTKDGKDGGGDNPLYIEEMLKFMTANADIFSYHAYFEEPEGDYINSALHINAPAAGAKFKEVSNQLRAGAASSQPPTPADTAPPGDAEITDPQSSTPPTAQSATAPQPPVDRPVAADPRDRNAEWAPASNGHGPLPVPTGP